MGRSMLLEIQRQDDTQQDCLVTIRPTVREKCNEHQNHCFNCPLVAQIPKLAVAVVLQNLRADLSLCSTR